MPLSWIDTHCHLDAPAFAADRLAVRAAARAAGVGHCVLVAVERSNWQAVRDLAHATGDSYALGIHPLFTPQAQESDIAALRAQLEQWQDDPHGLTPRDLAMHVAASRPEVVKPEDVSAERVAKEKEILIAQAADSGKPREIIEKMISGRMSKFLNEIALTGQPFVKNPDQTVGDLLNAAGNATVLEFARFEVGEGIEKAPTADFASEVMAQVRGS